MVSRISSFALLFIICALLCCDMAIRLAQAKETHVLGSVSAHQFLLVNDRGKVSAKIEDSQGKGPAILLLDKNGDARTVISVNPKGDSLIAIVDNYGRAIISLQENQGEPVEIIGHTHKQAIMLSTEQSGVAGIEFEDQADNPRLRIGCNADRTGGAVALYDSVGNRKAELTENGVDTDQDKPKTK